MRTIILIFAITFLVSISGCETLGKVKDYGKEKIKDCWENRCISNSKKK